MSPQEIVARATIEPSWLSWPDRASLFALRAMRLRQLARGGHAMADYLGFVADLAEAQQAQLDAAPALRVPDAAAVDEASRRGLPPLPASEGPPDPAWRGMLQGIVAALRPQAPAGALPALEHLATADEAWLDRQADALLHNVRAGLDMACAPIVGAALQVLWTRMLLQLHERQASSTEAIGRLDDETVCPACGSTPTASITRSLGDAPGPRSLHCSLCSLQWHLVRSKCPHCLSMKALSYQSLDAGDDDDAEGASRRAAQAAVQAEACDDCGTYLKIVHADRDPFVEPVADDLASLTLDLLVGETGKRRHGVNLMLLLGEPAAAPPPDPGAA